MSTQNLSKKDMTLEWVIPKKAHRGSASTVNEDFILLKRIVSQEHGTKWNSKIMDFKKNCLDKYFPDFDIEKDAIRVAFSFDKDRLLCVFDPPKDAPCFILGKNGSGKAINNSTLIDDIYEFFKLDKTKKYYYLKIHFYAEFENFNVYRLTPQNYETMLPIFEDELTGQMT